MSVKTANCGVFRGIESLCLFRVSVAKRRLAVTFPSRIRFLLVACGEFFLQQAGLFFFFFLFFLRSEARRFGDGVGVEVEVGEAVFECFAGFF